MICSRCSQWNSPDDHRCKRCAERLNDRRVASAFHSHGSLALQADSQAAATAVLDTPADRPVLHRQNDEIWQQARTPLHAAATQQSLFGRSDGQRVVSIGGDEPAQRRPRRSPQPRRKPVSASYLPEQGVLEFVPVMLPQPRRLATQVEARIYCAVPIASVRHRVFAAIYDFGIIAAMLCTFFGLLLWSCDGLMNVVADPLCAGVLIAAAVLLGLIYEGIFLAVTGQTPGMKLARLRLVDFDGRDVTEGQMHMRIFGGVVSLLPCAIGLLWAMLDEESLTWQDHISHTFPTPVSSE